MTSENDAGGKTTILVVDDVEELLSVIELILTDAGYSVLMANCGREAVRIFETKKDEIALTLLDVELPDINGIEVFKKIKLISRDAKVIFASSYYRDEIIDMLINASGLSFLHKPFGNIELFSQIKNALSIG
ncbi:MAG TPA: response regulator [bacterium]|nr:response regulator [bacterium]